MTGDERRAVRVGAAVLVAIAVAIAWVLLSDDLRLRRTVRVSVVLSHVGGLRAGAAVQVAGAQIGDVERIAMRGQAVVAHVRIERRYAGRCPINGEWFVGSKGVFGERYLEVGPPARGAAPGRPVRDGDVVHAVDPPQFDRLAAVSAGNLAAARALARDVAPEWAQLTAALADAERTWSTVRPEPADALRAVSAGGGLFAELGASRQFWSDAGASAGDLEAVAGRARVAMAAARARIAALREQMDALADGAARARTRVAPARWAAFDRAYRDARAVATRAEATLARAEQLAAFVASGQGTLGGLLADHELRDVAKQLQRIIKRQTWEVVGHPDMQRRP
ncbi:MAG: MCE family protein [Deltaproteobacteria bacterium]|nr:MAG: MCE family protein [Deltaproteobacteria bacterium]